MMSFLKNCKKQFKKLFHLDSSKQVKYLPQSDVLEEHQSLRLMLAAIATVCAITFLLILWAAVTKVEETAITFGEVIPEDKVQVAQHLEGGIVAKILVKNSQAVEKNQILFELDSAAGLAELEEMQAREAGLLFDSKRLKLFLSQSQENDKTSKIKIKHENLLSDQVAIDKMVQEEQLLLHNQFVARKDQQAVLLAQIAQHEEEIKNYQQQSSTLKEKVNLLKKEKKISDELIVDKLISEKEHLQLLRDVNQAQGDLKKSIIEEKKSKQALIETKERMNELNSGLEQAASEKLVEIISELIQTQKNISKLSDKVNRLNVRAPVSGIVKGIEVGVGSVIEPGAVLAEVVPQGTKLVAETRVSTKDIGHVNVGDPVTVKVTTYDFSRYGSVAGELERLSATTFYDQQKDETYYLATIILDQQFVGKQSGRSPLLPGMTVQADIKTGEKTILQYILKPIHLALNSGFIER